MRSKIKFILSALAMGTVFLLASNADSQVAANNQLALSQLITPAEMNPVESKYYEKITDPSVAKGFIITRSYVRLCQKVIDKTMPAEQLPDKPLGFAARYLLPGEATIINTAISDSIIAAAHGK